MKACPWVKLDSFRSAFEFEEFLDWITDTIAEGKAKEIKVSSRYGNISAFAEQWFKHVESGEIWRLVRPDYPFTGLFKRVSELELTTGKYDGD